MPLSREAIQEGLGQIAGPERVITDQEVLRDSSHDRFRKYETLMGVYKLPFPAAVVKPADTAQVSEILRFCNENRINCVPRTGGSATEGGLETIVENSVVLDGSDLSRILEIDPVSMLARAQCGVPLQVLEDEVRKQGLTMGHSPQSKPLAQLGGLVATRSIGQFSTLYGGIEDMVAGLEAVFPNGEITRIKSNPRRACGPDIRHVIIGNEGALCFITEVTVKLHRFYPEHLRYYGYALDDMEPGFEILREIITAGYRPSMARLYDPEDGAQHGFDQFAPGKCLLIFLAEGPEPISRAIGQGIEQAIAGHPECEAVDSRIIQNWFGHLNWGPEQIAAEREKILATHNMGFTTEVSGNWGDIYSIYKNALTRIERDFPTWTTSPCWADIPPTATRPGPTCILCMITM